MSDEEAARIRALSAVCEPAALEIIEVASVTVHQADRILQYSQTLSLRRIADALERGFTVSGEL